jgi:hypothetical protein
LCEHVVASGTTRSDPAVDCDSKSSGGDDKTDEITHLLQANAINETLRSNEINHMLPHGLHSLMQRYAFLSADIASAAPIVCGDNLWDEIRVGF